MNTYTIIIVAALLAEYLLGIVSNVLNLRHLRPTPPAELSDIYDEEDYRRSQQYTRTRTRFGLLTSTFDLAVLLAFWFAGGFEWLDTFVRGFEWNPVWTGLAFVGILGLANAVLSLPFSIYSTFVIEERFGFNESSVHTFVMDILKGTGLSILIGGPILAAVLAFFTYTGPYAWVYAWICVTVVTLVLQYAAPRYIMPLFNDFDPLKDDELREAILSYTRSVEFPLEGVYVMDGSKRSSKSNAFFTGFGSNKRIVLFDTLIENHTVDELVGIVAHEVGHYKKKHILKNMAITIVHTGILFLLLSVFLQSEGLFAAFYVDQTSVYAGLLFFGLLFTPIEMLLSVPMQMLSRRYEYEADRFAAATTDTPRALLNGLKKLSEHNLSNLTPHPFYVFLNYSHPPLLERLKALDEALAEQLEIRASAT